MTDIPLDKYIEKIGYSEYDDTYKEMVEADKIKLTLQNFKIDFFRFDSLLEYQDEKRVKLYLWEILTKHFGTSFTETSPSNFCEKGMQETLSATKETSDGVERHTKTLGSNL